MARYQQGWDAADAVNQQQADEAGRGTFVSLSDDGDSVRGVVVGSPLVRFRHWNGASTVNCEGPSCPLCQQGIKTKVQYAFSFFDMDLKAMRILSLNSMTYPTLLEYRDNPQFGLSSWAYQVKRRGAKGDTNTSYLITPHAQLTQEQRAWVSSQGPPNLAVECGLVGGPSVPTQQAYQPPPNGGQQQLPQGQVPRTVTQGSPGYTPSGGTGYARQAGEQQLPPTQAGPATFDDDSIPF